MDLSRIFWPNIWAKSTIVKKYLSIIQAAMEDFWAKDIAIKYLGVKSIHGRVCLDLELVFLVVHVLKSINSDKQIWLVFPSCVFSFP